MRALWHVAVLAALCVSGCKAGPAVLSAFFGAPEEDGMVEVEGVETFHRTWAREDVDWMKFKKIVIPPVNTTYLRGMSWWDDTNLSGQDVEGIRELAEFTRKTFIEAHRNNKHKYRLEVVEAPDEQTVILELAITEIVPTKPWLNSVSFVGTMIAFDKGTVAMESRLRDGGTREVIAKFADREGGKTNLIGNVKDFTWYGHAKDIIREWADQSVAITNSEEQDVIEDSSAFEWKVW